ncbi:MAG: tetratricopeptide repeat protein [Thiotrichaceae bacterium]|nr:tetratricopeptide repeat protein [Thiotrichaceae bacterium]
MNELKTDTEKAEEIKRWWKENGISVIVGSALAISAVLGWQKWQAYQVESAQNSSAAYAQHIKKEASSTSKEFSALKKATSSSPYAALAALDAAKQASEQGDNKTAITELKWAISQGGDKILVEVANIRLARIYIADKQYDLAKTTLNQGYSTAYASLIEELKGDLYRAQNKSKEAAEAYTKAIQLSKGQPPRYLQMKLDNIGEGA